VLTVFVFSFQNTTNHYSHSYITTKIVSIYTSIDGFYWFLCCNRELTFVYFAQTSSHIPLRLYINEMNMLSYTNSRDGCSQEVKRNRQYSDTSGAIFLYTQSDQIGSSSICMNNKQFTYQVTDLMPDFLTCNTDVMHQTCVDLCNVFETVGAIKT